MKVFECAGKRYRMTRQRQAVLDVLKRADSRPDAVWVHEQVRKVVPDITMATIQRTISLLREAGFIDDMKAETPGKGGRARRGAVRTASDGVHCEVRCVRCGRVVEIQDGSCEDLVARTASATGFVITGHYMDFYGLCPHCAQERGRTRS